MNIQLQRPGVKNRIFDVLDTGRRIGLEPERILLSTSDWEFFVVESAQSPKDLDPGKEAKFKGIPIGPSMSSESYVRFKEKI